MLQGRWKIPCAATKTWCSQINIKKQKPRCSPEGVRGPPWPRVSPFCLPHFPVLMFIPWIHFLWAFSKPLPVSSSEVRTWPNSSLLPSPGQLNVAGGNCPASLAGLTLTREITDLKGAQDVLSLSLVSWLSVRLQFDLFPSRPPTHPGLPYSWGSHPSLRCADWSHQLGTPSLPSTRAQAPQLPIHYQSPSPWVPSYFSRIEIISVLFSFLPSFLPSPFPLLLLLLRLLLIVLPLLLPSSCTISSHISCCNPF